MTIDRDDHAQVVPLVAQAAELTETPLVQVLAEGGYHAAATLTACNLRTLARLWAAARHPSPPQPLLPSVAAAPPAPTPA